MSGLKRIVADKRRAHSPGPHSGGTWIEMAQFSAPARRNMPSGSRPFFSVFKAYGYPEAGPRLSVVWRIVRRPHFCGMYRRNVAAFAGLKIELYGEVPGEWRISVLAMPEEPTETEIQEMYWRRKT